MPWLFFVCQYAGVLFHLVSDPPEHPVSAVGLNLGGWTLGSANAPQMPMVLGRTTPIDGGVGRHSWKLGPSVRTEGIIRTELLGRSCRCGMRGVWDKGRVNRGNASSALKIDCRR